MWCECVLVWMSMSAYRFWWWLSFESFDKCTQNEEHNAHRTNVRSTFAKKCDREREREKKVTFQTSSSNSWKWKRNFCTWYSVCDVRVFPFHFCFARFYSRSPHFALVGMNEKVSFSLFFSLCVTSIWNSCIFFFPEFFKALVFFFHVIWFFFLFKISVRNLSTLIYTTCL